MGDNLVDDLRLFDKRDDFHLATTCRTTKRIHLVDLTPSKNEHHILQENFRNNEKVSDKIQYVPDDVGDRSLPQQGW